MEQKIYKFGDIAVRITYLYPYFARFAAGYECDEAPEMELVMTEEDIENERARSQDGANFPKEYLETLAVYRKFCTQALEKKVYLFHCSAVAVDGKAYLFTAASGTGKSTHVRLWRELLGDRAVMVNDDKPLLRLKEDGTVLVYGTPWNGKHRLSNNVCCPVQAICILNRGEENGIEKISAQDAFPRLLVQTYRPDGREKWKEVIDGVVKISHGVDLWSLHCNMELQAAELSYNTMKGEGV